MVLEEGVTLSLKRELSSLEKQGVIKAFEFTHELSWNVLKDFLIDRGQHDIYGSKDAIRKAYQLGLIKDGDSWMGMVRDRNLSSHTYDEIRADKLISRIQKTYLAAFLEMKQDLGELAE